MFNLKTPDVSLFLVLSTSFSSTSSSSSSLFCSLHLLFPSPSLSPFPFSSSFSLPPLFPSSLPLPLSPSSFNLSFIIYNFSTSTFSTLSKKIILLPNAFGHVIWDHLENSEVFLEIKRLYERLLGTRMESMCTARKFSKLECYTAIKNDGPGNYEIA